MFNPLGRLSALSKLAVWHKANNSVLGIDIGTSSLKVIQLRREHGQVVLETYGEIATGPYRDLAVGQVAILSPDKQAAVLKDLFTEANVTTDQVAFSLPLGTSLLMTLEIPHMEESALAKVVPLEARKYIPVPITEVTLDWSLIPKAPVNQGEESGKTEVLVVAIHNSTINQYQSVGETMKLKSAFLEIETFSALRSSFAGDLSTTAVIDLGAGTTKMVIMDYGIVKLSHTIGKGAQDISVAISRSLGVDFAKAEEIKRRVGLVERLETGQDIVQSVSSILEYIFTEVRKVISDFQAKHKRVVNKIVLIGGGALLKGLPDLAGKQLGLPVTLGQPFEKVAAPAFLQPVLNEAGPVFAVSIGLALRHLQTLE